MYYYIQSWVFNFWLNIKILSLTKTKKEKKKKEEEK